MLRIEAGGLPGQLCAGIDSMENENSVPARKVVSDSANHWPTILMTMSNGARQFGQIFGLKR